ncbi:MAG: hypothetical protein QW633_03780 [Candidatus Aenigmatarchaeota archaeon]
MKGIVLSNLLYLFVFIMIWAMLITVAKPVIDKTLDNMVSSFVVEMNITDVRENSSYKMGKSILDGILYVLIPIVAVIFLLRSASVEEREYY